MNRLILYPMALCFCLNLFGYSLGNPDAPKGGKITIGMPSYPKSLLYYLAYGEPSLMVGGLVLETLIEFHPETYEPIPLLASKWDVSKDKKTFTFKINPQAKFSDQRPVTAEDVKFTWDALMNPKNKTVPMRVFLSSFESCKVIDKYTVQFKAKTIHFKNLEKVGTLFILPKHFFSKGNFNKSFNQKILGSGPYLLRKVRKNRLVTVKRNPKYWGQKLPQNIGRFNFDTIRFKAVPDYNVQFEMFKKGDIDYFYFLVSKMWVRETKGPKFKNNYILKLRAENSSPSGMQAIAWNLRNPLFKDRKLRLALAHLMNRDKWIKDLFYNQYAKSTGLVAVNSEYHSQEMKPIPYSPKKARQLLKAAGWRKVDTDGVLFREDTRQLADGKTTQSKTRLEFEVLASSKSLERLLTVYQEDLKKMGIKMSIRIVDWATSMKLIEDFKFDATLVARSRGVEPSDFSVMWGSEHADVKGSRNLTGYKNTEVDKLASEIDQTFDKSKRMHLVKRLNKIIVNDQPVGFTYEPTFYRLAYWNKFSHPSKPYFKYSNWKDTFHYWWFDKEKDKKLQVAIKNKSPVR